MFHLRERRGIFIPFERRGEVYLFLLRERRGIFIPFERRRQVYFTPFEKRRGIFIPFDRREETYTSHEYISRCNNIIKSERLTVSSCLTC